MTEATLERANQIKKEIDRLEHEISRLPRELLSSCNEKYAERILVKQYKVKLMRGIFNDEELMTLTDEDLKALVDIRRRRVEELKTELEGLS